MEKISFTETLELNDLQAMNYYVLKHKMTVYFNQLLLVGLSVGLIVLSIQQSRWGILAIGGLVLVYGIALFWPLQKKILFRGVKNTNPEDMKVNIEIDEEGICYVLDEEKDQEYPKYKWHQIAKVVNLPEYIYLFLSASSVIIIKKGDCEEIDEVVNLLREQYTNTNKYKEK